MCHQQHRINTVNVTDHNSYDIYGGCRQKLADMRTVVNGLGLQLNAVLPHWSVGQPDSLAEFIVCSP